VVDDEREEEVTTDELRDWHAMRAGWTMRCGQWRRDCPERGEYKYHPSHPFPATIDGAASAMPPDAVWIRFAGEWRAFVDEIEYAVVDTGDEIHDRYALAKEVLEENEA
jgi:hypothetical protein